MMLALGSLTIFSQATCAQALDATSKSQARSKVPVSKELVSKSKEVSKARSPVVHQANPHLPKTKPSIYTSVQELYPSYTPVRRDPAGRTVASSRKVILPADDCLDRPSQKSPQIMDNPWPDGNPVQELRFRNFRRLQGSIGEQRKNEQRSEPDKPVVEQPYECFNCGLG